MNGSKLGDRPLRVDWAFKTGPIDDAKRWCYTLYFNWIF